MSLISQSLAMDALVCGGFPGRVGDLGPACWKTAALEKGVPGNCEPTSLVVGGGRVQTRRGESGCGGGCNNVY